MNLTHYRDLKEWLFMPWRRPFLERSTHFSGGRNGRFIGASGCVLRGGIELWPTP